MVIFKNLDGFLKILVEYGSCILLNRAFLKASSFNPKTNHRLPWAPLFASTLCMTKCPLLRSQSKPDRLTRTNSVHSTEMAGIVLTVVITGAVRCKNWVGLKNDCVPPKLSKNDHVPPKFEK